MIPKVRMSGGMEQLFARTRDKIARIGLRTASKRRRYTSEKKSISIADRSEKLKELPYGLARRLLSLYFIFIFSLFPLLVLSPRAHRCHNSQQVERLSIWSPTYTSRKFA